MTIEINAPSENCTLSWSPSSQISLDEFLACTRPSTTLNNGSNSEPYVWVLKSRRIPSRSYEECIEEASTILRETAQKVTEIKNNPDIPVCAKKGVRNKKQIREEVQKSAAASLKEVSMKHGFVAGKWVAFLSENEIDAIFSDVARSLISGELLKTAATHVGVNMSRLKDSKVLFHLFVYLPNVYNEGMARKIMTLLIEKHGLKLTGAKPNFYTSIHLDRKHESGIPATVWTGQGGPGSLMTKDEVAALLHTFNAAQAPNDGRVKEKKMKATIKAKNRTKENRVDSKDEEDVSVTSAPRKRPRDSDDYKAEGEPPQKMVKLEGTSAIARRVVRPRG